MKDKREDCDGMEPFKMKKKRYIETFLLAPPCLLQPFQSHNYGSNLISKIDLDIEGSMPMAPSVSPF